MTEVLHEARLHIKKKKSFAVEKTTQKVRKERGRFVDALKSQTKVDRGTNVELQDSFDAWVENVQ